MEFCGLALSAGLVFVIFGGFEKHWVFGEVFGEVLGEVLGEVFKNLK